jgi:PIN domain nuclease of toxin-antitoxin system
MVRAFSLLDTHAFLWFAAGDRRLSARARAAMEADDAVLHISAASVWEMAIKISLGRLTLPDRVDVYLRDKMDEGYRVLPITWAHAAAVETLPFHHRDPFDRLLVAHARAERWPVVTRDRIFRRYGVDVIW